MALMTNFTYFTNSTGLKVEPGTSDKVLGKVGVDSRGIRVRILALTSSIARGISDALGDTLRAIEGISDISGRNWISDIYSKGLLYSFYRWHFYCIQKLRKI
jgi:hypothetical protein